MRWRSGKSCDPRSGGGATGCAYARGMGAITLTAANFEQTVTDHFQQMLDDGIVRKRPSIRLP